MKKYDKYKDSGIEWIGKIPEHWEIKRGKSLFNFQNGYPFDSQNFSNTLGNGLQLIRIRDINRNFSNTFWEGDYIEDALVNDNDILIGMDGDFNVSCWQGGRALLNQRVCKIIAHKNCINKYLYYLIPLILNVINDLTYYTTVKHLSNSDLWNSFFPLPLLHEQKAIANFLDEKTAKIDDLIAKKEKLIELLNEEKAAIINEAVTKGIDPNVKLKPSGIDWLGDIPEHWKFKKLKYFGEVISGAPIASTAFLPYGVIKVLKITNIQNNYIDWDGIEFVSEDIWQKENHCRIIDGDIVFALTRPIISTGIKSAMVFINKSDKVLLNQRNAIIRISPEIDKTFFYYVIHSKYFYEMFEKSIDQTGQQPNISPNAIKNFQIFFPQLNEQKNITNFIISITKSIETSASKIQKEIELLKEYKTALISEAVTGKIKVCH